MYFLGQTLNVFTLGGLALAVGRLVDDSIVELENINRHLNMPGKPRRHAVLDAAREVAMPIFVSTITTIVVFLPTVFLDGQAKLLFIPLTFTISFSLFASFLVSRTVTPLSACTGSSRRARERARNLYDAGVSAARGRVLGAARRGATSGRSAGRSGTARRSIGGILVARRDRGRRSCRSSAPSSSRGRTRASSSSAIRAPVGTRVEETERIVERMEGIIRATLAPGEFTTIVSTVGVPVGPLGRLLAEHRAPRGPAPGVPGRSRPAEAQ